MEIIFNARPIVYENEHEHTLFLLDLSVERRDMEEVRMSANVNVTAPDTARVIWMGTESR